MKIAFAGKGGTGKTTLAAWTSDYLARQGHNVWLIDADTAMSLGRASGLDLDEMPEPLTAHEDLINERIGNGLLNLNPEVSDLPDSLSVEIDGTDSSGRKRLLVMGTVATAGGGCACHANALLKAVLGHLMYDQDDYVVIDLEAGVEHLGRGTIEKVDILVVVTEPSLRSLETARQVSTLADSLGLHNQVLAFNRSDKESIGSLPSEIREKLPKEHVIVPVLPGLSDRMLSTASVIGLPEQDEVDGIIRELLAFIQMPQAIKSPGDSAPDMS